MTVSSGSTFVVLVTGAASGIGRATAHLFAQQGVTVWCADRNLLGCQETADRIHAHQGKAFACTLDVTEESAWESCIDRIGKESGRLDVLVNSAGISFASPVWDMRIEDWHRVLAVNLDGVFLGTKYGIRAMRSTGGSIVHVASASGIRPAAGASAYSTSKAATIMFCKTAAKECRDQGIPVRINTVCPAGVKTPMWTSMPFFQELVQKTGSEEAAYQAMSAQSPGDRFADPEEIAQAILYLCSDPAKGITGTDLIIDAGYTL